MDRDDWNHSPELMISRDIRCPTLWLAGSRNTSAIAAIRECEAMLKGSKVQAQIVEGLDHIQEFTEFDKVLPVMLTFTQQLRLTAQ
jgi:hypothetical protein